MVAWTQATVTSVSTEILNSDGYYILQGYIVGESSACGQDDWRHIGTFGRSLAMYRKGYRRRLVDPDGNIVVEYTLE